MKTKKIPFPQANNIELIYKIIFDIGQDGINKHDIVNKYGIDMRQGSYYLDALLYLGLVEKINTKYFLNEKGVSIRLSSPEKAKDVFVEYLLGQDFFCRVYNYSKENGVDSKEMIAKMITDEYGLNFTTAKRRASTIINWLKWVNNEK